jgi:hypothetical protein
MRLDTFEVNTGPLNTLRRYGLWVKVPVLGALIRRKRPKNVEKRALLAIS